VKIGTLEIGPGQPCAIIAEIGNAHNGSFGRAIHLLDAAKACGASAAKLQSYTPDELIALRGDGPAPAQWGEQGYTMSTLYEKARTPLDWLPLLYDYASHIGLPLFSSVFGPESLAALEAVGNPCYKIARLDNQHYRLVDAVIATGKPFLVSAGPEDRPRHTMVHHPDPEYVKSHPGGWPVSGEHLLWCPPGYPQTAFGFQRGAAGTDYDDPGTDGTFGENHIGFSYHGTDSRPCVVAATLGAKIIEAHFMLDDEPSELEANVSLSETAFARMVADVRATEVLLGH
jgi:pseudaminic acid synthase